MNDPLLNERMAYVNGEYVPESRATVSISDRGFIFGDAVFDTARTFGGKIYRLQEHVDRLFRSLRYVQIDPGLSTAEFCAISEQVVERNLHLLGPGDDYWVFLRVTRGPNYPDSPGGDAGATVIATCVPLPLAKRAPLRSAPLRSASRSWAPSRAAPARSAKRRLPPSHEPLLRSRSRSAGSAVFCLGAMASPGWREKGRPNHNPCFSFC